MWEGTKSRLGTMGAAALRAVRDAGATAYSGLRTAIALAVAGIGVYACYRHPPIENVDRGELALRLNRLTGGYSEFRDGAVLVVPGVHELRRFSLRDHIYRPAGGGSANGAAPFQTVEGLSIGVDVAVRYALDSVKVSAVARALPQDIGRDIVEPVVQGVLYKTLAHYTVREIFSTKRAEIQQTMLQELQPLLAQDGIRLQAVMMGRVDLPTDYKAGMEKLLAEELATEQMRYTLELKDRQVKQSALEAEAEKVRREKAAEAAGQEQIIAARAQAEAMKHVLPFKQKQIEQRALEADADKVARIKSAEATAQARQIEAVGEAESRRKLADAEAYRQERIGAVASAQLERDGALISRNPLLIQKTLADKLSDKISVIIAPPPADGGFIGASLLGSNRLARTSGVRDSTAGASPAVLESGEMGGGAPENAAAQPNDTVESTQRSQ